MPEWSFLTNHARALVCIAHDPGVRLRDIAAALGITERRAYDNNTREPTRRARTT
jgi:prophage antirepressor-like protein